MSEEFALSGINATAKTIGAEPALTLEEEIAIADRIAFDLVAANGQHAWNTQALTEGICGPERLYHHPGSYRRIAQQAAKWHRLYLDPVNNLYFRPDEDGKLLGDSVTDSAVAKTYLKGPGRPPMGLRLQTGEDDPFAVLATQASVVRAAGALPRAAERLVQQQRNGRLSDAAAGRMVTAASQRYAALVTPELEGTARRMIEAPSAE